MQAYDLEKSFEKGQPGFEQKALYDAAGNKVGSSALWEAGADAFNLLQSRFARTTDDPVSVAVFDIRYEVMRDVVAQYLDGEVVAALREHRGSKRHQVAAQSWSTLELPSKALFLLELLDAGLAPHAQRAGFYDFLRIVAAVALLMRLDCAIFAQERAQTIDALAARAKRHSTAGERVQLGDDQPIMDVATFRRVLMSEHSVATLLRDLRKQFGERARAGAHARAAGYRRARAFVEAEWTEHRAAYSGNKSEFARHYARRIAKEMEVKVKDRTICEWLAAL